MEFEDVYENIDLRADNSNSLGVWDYVVFTLTLLITFGIGAYHGLAGGGQKTTSDYFSANRQLSPFPVALSIIMSFISGILVLGTSAEMYIYGTQLWLESLGRSIVYPISAYFFVPMMYRLKITSVFEYHKRRYDSDVLRIVCTVLMMLYAITYMGMSMYAPATALEGVTGFPIWASLVCTGVLAVIYTTIGGIKAVVWTGFFQGIVMFTGIFIVLVAGCVKVGGLDKVWEISKEGGRIKFFDMNPDPTERATFWTVMVGAFSGISQCANEQYQIQKYCSLPNVRDATLVIWWQIPMLILVYILVCLCGLTMYAYYELAGCDPYRSGAVASTNQLLPYFLVDGIAYDGLTGLFIAVLFTGALSNVSSSMNALAAITWKDFLEKRFSKSSETKKTVITKITAFTYGMIGVAVGFIMQFFKGNIMQLARALLSSMNAPLTGVVIAGAFFPWVQWKGMTIGVLSGICLFLWINIGQFITYPHRSYLNTTVDNCSFGVNETALPIEEDIEDVFWLYKLSFLYIPLGSLITTIVVGVLASLLTGKQDPKTVDPMTMINLGERCGCCYPQSCKDNCTCGVRYEDIKDDCDEQIQHDSTDSKVVSNWNTSAEVNGHIVNGPIVNEHVGHKDSENLGQVNNAFYEENVFSTNL